MPVEFTPDEIRRILQHSPLPDPLPDSTNRFATDPAAAHLGQYLFFETRFSANHAVSCATCHDPQRSFTDGRQLAQGIATVDRHAPALWNVTHNRWFFWDGRTDSLWSQALVPLERDDEFGGDRALCAQVIYNDRALRQAYERVFGPMPDLADRGRFPHSAKPLPGKPDDPRHQAWLKMKEDDRHAINTIFANLGKAIAAYETKIVSRDAPFDRFVQGLNERDSQKMLAIRDSAKRGLKIFIGKGNCRLCHTGPNFTDGEFHSVGLGDLPHPAPPPGPNSPPIPAGAPDTVPAEPTDPGRYRGIEQLKTNPFNAAGVFSDDHQAAGGGGDGGGGGGGGGGAAAQRLSFLINKPDNWGQFKTPTLRNVAITPPYMHQGHFATLREVIEHYSTLKEAVQIGHHREKILQPLNLSEQEIMDLEAFLESLTSDDLPESLLVRPGSPLPPQGSPFPTED